MSSMFFFSYARDDRDAYLDKFYELLVEDVRSLSGVPRSQIDEVAFRDIQSIPHGAEWEPTLAGALQSSGTFVAMCSATYYRREYCGKEWQYFGERMANNKHPGAAAAELPRLFPMLWDKLPRHQSPPETVLRLQFDEEQYGTEYKRDGLKMLVKRDSPAVSTIVRRLAERIVDATGANSLPPAAEPPKFSSVRNAFEPIATIAAPIAAESATSGPKYAQFVFIAGLRREFDLAHIERPDQAHGDDERDEWRPFHPPSAKSVREMVLEAVQGLQLYTDNLSFSADLSEKVRESEEKCKIVILLVDPWTLKLESYRNALAQYDKQQYYNATLLIPWNESDPLTAARKDDLDELIRETFRRQVVPRIRTGVKSAESLKDELIAAVNDCRSSIVRNLRVKQKPAGQRTETLPLVTGPKG